MIKDIFSIIKECCEMHKYVSTCRYQSEAVNNAQNNYKTYQVYVEDDALFQKLVSREGIFTCTLNLVCISQPSKDKSVIDIQDEALTFCSELIHYIGKNYREISIYDYSFLLLSDYTTDKSAGCRCTLEVVVPDAIDMCNYLDNFIPINEGKGTEEPEEAPQTLRLNPKKLR